MRVVLRLIALINGLLLCHAAFAQAYPAGPVRLVIPFAAGSATDVCARLIGKHLSDALGQPVIVEAGFVRTSIAETRTA